MNHAKVVKSILNKVEKMDIEYPYSVTRSIMMCNVIRKYYDEKEIKKKKEIISLLDSYFIFISDYKKVDGLKTLRDNYELQNVLISSLSSDNISNWIKENIIEKKKYIDRCEYHYNNNYSQNVFEEQIDMLERLKNIIVCNDFQYGDVILKIMDDLDLDFFFFFDNNRYKNQLIFSEYSLFNLVNYFDYFLSKVDLTFKRDNNFLSQFMITILFDQRNNFKIFHRILQNKKLNEQESLNFAENFIIKKFKQGFFRTKTQYYIKIGMNTNSKIQTFSMTRNKDILVQIHKITEKLNDNTLFDWFYLAFISDKNLTPLDISKIDRIAEDIAISNPKALVKNNGVDLFENKLVNDYIDVLNEAIKQNKPLISKDFIILDNSKNEYMINLFEGKIETNKKSYFIKISKIKGIVYTYINYKGMNVFKDRIFTKEDAKRIVEFIKYEEEWSR